MSSRYGHPPSSLRRTLVLTAPKYTWITQLSYIPAIVLTKVAILLFFIRVFPSRVFRRVCTGTIIYGFLFMISTIIALILSCVPVQATWSNWTGESGGVCFNNTAFFWAHSVRLVAVSGVGWVITCVAD